MLPLECGLASFLDWWLRWLFKWVFRIEMLQAVQCKCPFWNVLRPLSPSVNDIEEAIALKRSGEHIKGASTIFVVWWNGLQTPSQWQKLFWAISEDKLHKSSPTSKCKRWALSICVMPMYVHDAQCVPISHVFDQTGLGQHGGTLSIMWPMSCSNRPCVIATKTGNVSKHGQSLADSRLDCDFVLFFILVLL